MCGIVGLIAKNQNGFTTTQQKMFNQMLFADQLRGVDATGVIGIMKDGDFGIMKEATEAYVFNGTFINSQLDKDLYQKGIAVIGHNRAKTIGEHSDQNAHPFVEDGTFAMVHNGTLQNHKKLHDTDVDSHALTIVFKQAMDQEDWKTAMEEALGKVTGALACVWYDQKRHQLCMIRNSQRPLGIVETTSCILFASEVMLPSWIASRNSEKVDKMMALKEHTLYQFDLKKPGGVFSETNLFPKFSLMPARGFTNGVTKTSATTVPFVSATNTGTKSKEAPASIGATVIPWSGNDKQEVLSKNAYKRLRRQIFRKTIRFDVEDVIGTNDAVSVLLFGTSTNGAYDLCDVRHSIRCPIAFREHGFKNIYNMWNKDVEFEAIVSDTEYDADTGGIVIQVESLKNVTEGHTYEKAEHTTH